MKFKRFIKNELSGWKKSEIIWISVSCSIIILLSLYQKDNITGIISSLTGIMYTLCIGKGKLCAYIFGIINCILYSYISFTAGLYGETMLNILYYLPMQFIGFFVWRKNINSSTHEINKRHIKNKERLLILTAIIFFTYIYGNILKKSGDPFPFTDSFTTISSIFAMILSVKMYSEQWWIWLSVNSLSIYMWSFFSDNTATLIMWILYLINGIILGYKWEKEIYKNNCKKVYKNRG